MKQSSKDTLCYYCLGCNKLEYEKFEGARNCKNFIPGRENWRELIEKELKKKVLVFKRIGGKIK